VKRLAALVLVAVAAMLAAGIFTGEPSLAKSRRREVVVAPRGLLLAGDVAARQFTASDSMSVDAAQGHMMSRGALIIVHGLGEYDSLFARWMLPLRTASEMNVIAFSLRGTGRSSGVRGDAAHADDYLRDLGGIVRELKRRSPSGPVVLVAGPSGAGLLSRYLRDHERLASPGVQGAILLDPIDDFSVLRARGTGHPSPVAWNERRVRTLTWLGAVGIHALDRLPVAHQEVPSADGVKVRHYTMRAWRALLNPSLWADLRASRTPLLVLSASRPDSALYRVSDRHEWSAVPSGTDFSDPAVATVVRDWTAQFSADAAERRIIPPTQRVPLK
jgi:alpha-beta hydrolase superfamily lysophospholipase